jgi:Tripartite tricarboxylate transporter TctB family
MISRRVLEMLTGALTGSFGLVVLISSLDNGIGWSEAGVDAGTFPFLTGVIIVAGSLYNIIHGAFAGGAIVISRADLRRGAALFLPAVAFVGVIPWLGFYLASGAYMLGVLTVPRRLTLIRSLLIAVVTPVALYFVFERLFQVTLPHGALAAAIGY